MGKRQLNNNQAGVTMKTIPEFAGNFLLDMQDFFYNRIERINMKESRMGSQANNYAAFHFNKLQSILPEEGLFHLKELSDAHNELTAVTEELAYKNGFSDGIRFIMQSLSSSGI